MTLTGRKISQWLGSDKLPQIICPTSWHHQHQHQLKLTRQCDGRWVSNPKILELEITNEKWFAPLQDVLRTHGILFFVRKNVPGTYVLMNILSDFQGYIFAWENWDTSFLTVGANGNQPFYHHFVSRKGLPENWCSRLLNAYSVHPSSDAPPWNISHPYHTLTQQCDIFVNDYEQVCIWMWT